MRRRVGMAVFGVLAALVMLGVVELAARVASPARPTDQADLEFTRWSLDLLDPCMVEVRRGATPTLRETRAGVRHDTSPLGELPRARTAGVPRIAIVGESSAYMLGSNLRGLLTARPCGLSYELLSCGQPGSALEHLERRFDEVMTYQPDAVVVVFGHNLQFRFATDAWRLRLRVARVRSRALSRLGGALDTANDAPPPLPERLDRLERFLLRAGAEARRARVRLIVTTPGANLWMPPDEDTGAGSQSIPREANLREATEGPRSALASLPTTPAHPAVEFTRGVLLARASDFAAATVALRAAMDGDSVRTRAPVAVAERIRSVAPRAGFTLRDTAQALTARAPGGLSGWESFSDNCHMTDPRFQEEAEAVLDLARGSPPGGVLCGVHARPPPEDPAGQLQNLVSLAPRGPESGSSPWYRALSLMLESRALNDGSAWAEVARAYAASLRGEPAWISHVRGAIAEGLWRAGRRDDAETVNALGRASAGPVAAAAWMQRGLFSLRQGDRERAAAEFRRAVAMDPSSYEARWYAERARRP